MQHVCYGEVGEDRRPGRTRDAQPQIVRHPEDAVRTGEPAAEVGQRSLLKVQVVYVGQLAVNAALGGWLPAGSVSVTLRVVEAA